MMSHTTFTIESLSIMNFDVVSSRLLYLLLTGKNSFLNPFNSLIRMEDNNVIPRNSFFNMLLWNF